MQFQCAAGSPRVVQSQGDTVMCDWNIGQAADCCGFPGNTIMYDWKSGQAADCSCTVSVVWCLALQGSMALEAQGMHSCMQACAQAAVQALSELLA